MIKDLEYWPKLSNFSLKILIMTCLNHQKLMKTNKKSNATVKPNKPKNFKMYFFNFKHYYIDSNTCFQPALS